MTPLLANFVQEARDLLQSVATGLLALERNPGDAAAVNGVFRAVHTLKGSAGLFDIPALIHLVHAGEDLLDAVRESRIGLDGAIVDLLLEAVDHVSAWIDHLEEYELLPDSAHGISADLSRRLRGPLGDAPPPTSGSSAPLAVLPVTWLATLAESDRLAAFATGSVLAGEYRPDAQCFFSGEDPLHQVRQIPGLKALRVIEPAAWPALDALDPYACLLSFRFLATAPRAEVEHLFRYVPDQLTLVEVPPERLVSLHGERAPGPVFDDFAEMARSLLARSDLSGLGKAARTLLELSAPDTWQASGLRWLLAALDSAPHPAWLAALVEAIADGGPPVLDSAAAATTTRPAMPEPRGDGFDPLAQQLLTAQQRLIAQSAPADELPGRFAAAARAASAVLAALGRLDDAVAVEAAGEIALEQGSPRPLHDALRRLIGGEPLRAAPTTPEPPRVEQRADDRVHAKVLKVDQAKVDLLMTLIGELVVAKNGLPFLSRRAEQVFGSREMSREIKDQYGVIDRIAQEMQGAIMQIRMLPVSQMFQRFPRLVRDLSRKLDKSIELVIEGEDTEADKDVIETLGDPLLHLVRNAIDHGIELPAERLASGKAETATVRLTAYQEADAVVLEIADDGRGIDPARMRAKAVEKGLIDPARAAEMSDTEAVRLILLAGFSTAEQVTDLSGRGVGMDVVRSAVEEAGGRVAIRSTLGEGTVVTLRLPLSMAVTRVLVVESDGRLFGVPMDIVAETVRIPCSAIRPFKNAETFVLRDSIVPILRLRRLLGLAETAGGSDEAILVARLNGGAVGIVIDQFKERVDIILKPLDGMLAGLPGYAGTALMGDGQVLPVLNLKELV